MNNDREKKIEAQEKYTKQNNLPHFAPHSGNCFRCGKDIYEKISLELAGSRLITSCPHCRRSYCD